MERVNDPYRPPYTEPELVDPEDDRAIADGCMIAFLCLGGFGGMSVAYAIYLWVRYAFDTDLEFPGRSSDIQDGLLIFAFGLAWSAAGILAHKMNHAWAFIFFFAGLVVFAAIVKFG